MTTSGALQRRVMRLEGSGGGKCPESSCDGHWSKVRRVSEPQSGHERNRYCGTCGRTTHIVLT